MPSNNYRDLLNPLDHPRFVQARQLNPREFGQVIRDLPAAEPLLGMWKKNIKDPYHGITCDGNCEHGLYNLRDEGAPNPEAVAAAQHLLRAIDPEKRERLCFPIDAEQWRYWSNPEFLVNDFGIRLEEENDTIRHLFLEIIKASLSTPGYEKTIGCMRTNAFLGELTQLPNLMNFWSYNFLLFGDPSTSEPWGWSMYGHHLCINCFFLEGQMVMTPIFMGAEPNVIDTGEFAGTVLFDKQETVALDLMRSFDGNLKKRAQIYKHIVNDPAMPKERYHPFDGLHLGGAFHDNRIIPNEGVRITEMNAKQRDQVMQITEAFLEVLPDKPLAAKLNDIEKHLDRTYWSWIGGLGDEDSFYYRIQSPVVMLEFDHHPGIWLNNTEPAKCHIHTVIRTPNGNDYGKDLLRLHYEESHQSKTIGQ